MLFYKIDSNRNHAQRNFWSDSVERPLQQPNWGWGAPLFIKWSLFSRVCELLDLDRLGKKRETKRKRTENFALKIQLCYMLYWLFMMPKEAQNSLDPTIVLHELFCLMWEKTVGRGEIQDDRTAWKEFILSGFFSFTFTHLYSRAEFQMII